MLTASDSNITVDGKDAIWVTIVPIIVILCAIIGVTVVVILVIIMSRKRCGKLNVSEMKVHPTGWQNAASHHNSGAMLRKETLNNMKFKLAQPYPKVTVEDNCQNETGTIAPPVYETIRKENNQTRNLSNRECCIDEAHYIHNNIMLKDEFLNSSLKDV